MSLAVDRLVVTKCSKCVDVDAMTKHIMHLTLFAEYGAAQSGDLTFDLSSVGEGVSAADLESLKIDIGKSLTDGLFKKLLDVEEV